MEDKNTMKKAYIAPVLVSETVVPDTALSSSCAGNFCDTKGLSFDSTVNAVDKPGGISGELYTDASYFYMCR